MSKVIYDSQLNAEPYETWGNETRGANMTVNYGNEGKNYSKEGDIKPWKDEGTDVNGAYKVRSYEYPLSKQNDHYVRFSINLTEESRLIRRNQIGVIGNADNSDQNRLNTNTAVSSAGGGMLSTAVGVGAAAAVSPLVIGAAASKLAAVFTAKGAVAATGLIAAGTLASNTEAGRAVTNTVGNAVSDAASGVAEYVGKELDDVFAFTNKLKRLASQITLYTPASVRVQYGMQYEILDNNLLAILAQERNYESLKQGLTNSSQYGETFTKLIQTLGATTDVGSLLSKRAINKRKDVMFKGVDNRSFTFDYVFAPRNAEEAHEVAGIIFMFKYFAHPELADGYMNFMFTYPAEFDIEYGYRTPGDDIIGETMNTSLNRISSCVLSGISIDYAPNGSFQTLEQGEPCMVIMGLQFQEIETLHRDKIGLGY